MINKRLCYCADTCADYDKVTVGIPDVTKNTNILMCHPETNIVACEDNYYINIYTSTLHLFVYTLCFFITFDCFSINIFKKQLDIKYGTYEQDTSTK